MAWCHPGDKPVLGRVKGLSQMDYGVIWLVISFGFFSWDIALEMVIPSGTVINRDVLWLRKSWKKYGGLWADGVALTIVTVGARASAHINLKSSDNFYYEICYCTYTVIDIPGFYIVSYLLFQVFFVAVNKIVNTTPEVTHPSLTRPGSGWVVTFISITPERFPSVTRCAQWPSFSRNWHYYLL